MSPPSRIFAEHIYAMDGHPRPPAPEQPPSAQSTPYSEDHERVLRYPKLFIGSGGYGYIHQIDPQHVIKEPHGDEAARLVLIDERLIYERLGSHEGIIKYCGLHDEATGAIKLEYANDGNLDDYVDAYEAPPAFARAAMIQRLADALLYMYDRGVMPQDIRPENTLVCDGVAKLADFGAGVVYDLKINVKENVTHDELVQRDLRGLCGLVYKIAAWDPYYSFDGEDISSNAGNLRPTDGLMAGRVLQRCWSGGYSTLKHFHEDLTFELMPVIYANMI